MSKKRSAILSLLLLLLGTFAPPLQGQEKWQGIDEAVIERFAQERGVEPADPLFDVEGDLLLFLFALAGGVGGFIMGYYWHKVFVAGKKEDPRP